MVAPLPLDKRETDRMRVQVSWHAVVLSQSVLVLFVSAL